MSISKKDLEDIIKSLKGELTTINNKLTKMETQFDTIMAENKELKSLVAERDSEILSLRSQLNVIEQYCSVSRWRPQKVDKRMVLEHTHGLFIT